MIIWLDFELQIRCFRSNYHQTQNCYTKEIIVTSNDFTHEISAD